MTFDEVLNRFKATRNGEGYKAHCPAHKDDSASLSVNLKGDKILVHCFAGCDLQSILDAVGLTTKDLYEDSRSPIVATYKYRDREGNLRYLKKRTADKQFWFEQPDGTKKMTGVQRHVYRRNELTSQTQIFITEGEKDADRLWSLGLAATTNDDGAGKWKDKLTAQLDGVTDAYVLEDNDPAGRDHVEIVAASCHAAGIRVRIIRLPGLPDKGDVSDWLDKGHSKDELFAFCLAAEAYSPKSAEEPSPAPYTFEPAFPPGHFVATWIETFSGQCDAALEFHEAAALVTLAAATPSLTARISGSADGLRTNLNILFVGDPSRSRKSTAKNYAVETLKRALPQVLLPEQMTQESFVESLTLCNGGAALWAIDEFTDTLSKIVNATYLAGMRGLLLELYARTDYTYRRVSKGAKKQEDFFAIRNVTLSVIGCATPTIFQNLDSTAVGSGLLTRFAIVMPQSKPPRIPQYELTDADVVPPALVKWLHEISERTKGQVVTFAPGVLQRLDEAIDAPLDESDDRCQMTVRSGVMARKAAMLSAAGRHTEFELANAPLVVELEDADAAIRVVTRWIGYARAFEERTDETSFEVRVQRCAALAKGRTVNRRVIAKRVHLSAKELKEIEETLVQRGEIEVITYQPSTGRPSYEWKWVGGVSELSSLS